jgi:hypothetical protein
MRAAWPGARASPTTAWAVVQIQDPRLRRCSDETKTRLAAALSGKAHEDLQKTDLLRADAATPVGRTVGSRVIRSAPGSLLLEGATMANKDKGGSKSSKTAASKSLKEKRQAKKAKATKK